MRFSALLKRCVMTAAVAAGIFPAAGAAAASSGVPQAPSVPERRQNVKKEPYFLNIAPMFPGHEAELAADIADMAKKGVITHNAFSVTLTQEGDPAVEKGAILGERFVRHRDALRKVSGVPCGILLQATVGHGWLPNDVTPGQRFVTLDGETPYIFCPLDPGFRKYLDRQIGILAACRPDFFMLDDDFRMITGRNGCFCPLHIAGFNRLTGRNYDFDTLTAAVRKRGEEAREYDAYLQKTMEETARIIRNAIDREMPGVPCSFCMCAEDIRHAAATGRVLQGNAPLRIRINNGYYTKESVRDIPFQMLRSARQALYLPEDCEVLDEPDTCPQNRYSTSAAMLHNHIARAMIAGYGGAKIWITRMGVFEPESGRAYRDVLAKYNGFYRTLCSLGFRDEGILVPLPEEAPFNFPLSLDTLAYRTGNYLTRAAVMGFPFRLDRAGCEFQIAALAGDDCDMLTDADVEKLLSGDLILDGSAALKLTKRGFAPKLGITASEWGDLPSPTWEYETEDAGSIKASLGNNPVRLAVNGNVEEKILSQFVHKASAISEEGRLVAPGSVMVRRPDGRMLFAMAASITRYNLTQPFSYLNETRKRQFAKVFGDRVGVYFRGDAEAMVQSGRDASGRRIVILHAMSADELERPALVFREKVETLERLMPDGSWETIPFAQKDGAVMPELTVKMLYPEVLRVK